MVYRIVEPDGHVCKLDADTDEQRMEQVNRQILKWQEYCSGNWISENRDQPYCSEDRVKLFLDGLAYFLLMGRAKDTISDYKNMANGKREIPASSCPPFVENAFYGIVDNSASRNKQTAEEPRGKKEKRKRAGKTKFDKVQKVKARFKDGAPEFIYAPIDTKNCFTVGGKKFRLDMSVKKYKPKLTDSGNLYDMDKVICACGHNGKIRFYDMDFEEIDKRLVREINPSKSNENGVK